MIPVSVAIITKNEEKNITDALESVREFDDIVIVDSFSSDRTAEICGLYTGRIFQREWQGYARQKQMAVDLAKNEWVLILDADERVTPELREEIRSSVSDSSCRGFYIPRKSFFLGKWVRHSGWWPDYVLRLFRKDSGRLDDRHVHEKVVLNGKAGRLMNPLIHMAYRSIGEFLYKADRYSTLAAIELKKENRHVNPASFIFRPVITFLKIFLIRQGFRDGVNGLILSLLYSYYTFLKYVKAWEK